MFLPTWKVKEPLSTLNCFHLYLVSNIFALFAPDWNKVKNQGEKSTLGNKLLKVQCRTFNLLLILHVKWKGFVSQWCSYGGIREYMPWGECHLGDTFFFAHTPPQEQLHTSLNSWWICLTNSLSDLMATIQCAHEGGAEESIEVMRWHRENRYVDTYLLHTYTCTDRFIIYKQIDKPFR